MRSGLIRLMGSLLALLLFGLAWGQERSGPTVVVNGATIDAPVRMEHDSLLLPMRAVFEALQAEVHWYPMSQVIVAVRGGDRVVLVLGRKGALVNDKELPLPVAPSLIDDATYVPLRFPAEAFGGDVKWNDAAQTATITIAPLTETPAANPETPPAPGDTHPITNPDTSVKPNTPPDDTAQPTPPDDTPPPAAPAQLTGVLDSKNTDKGQELVFYELMNQDLEGVTLAPDAVITRNPVNSPLQRVTFADLQPGDLLKMTFSEDGSKVTNVAATYMQVTGTITNIENNQVTLQDGSHYDINPEVQFRDPQGQPVDVPAADVAENYPENVTMNVTPTTNTVWVIVLPHHDRPQPRPHAPRIFSVGVEHYRGPLRTGETLNVQVLGTPGADEVTARIGEAITGIRLREREPGRYQGRVTIDREINVKGATIFAMLRTGAARTDEVPSEQQVTIDSAAPRITRLLPQDNARLTDHSPTITASFTDDGSEIDPKAVTLSVNGVDVTRNAHITTRTLTYRAHNLPDGPVDLHLAVADNARNTTEADWRVTLVSEHEEPAIAALTHDARKPLRAGQALHLSAKLTARPAKLEWYLGTKLISTEVHADAALNYTTAYTIAPDDPAGAGQVSLLCFTDDRHSQVAYAKQPVVIAVTPTIATVTAPGYAGPLKVGDALTIQVTGTPGAEQVMAHIGEAVWNIRLAETAPGTYTQRVTIAPNTTASNAPIIATMRLGGVETAEVRSTQPVTIDTTPPRITAVSPRDGAQVTEHTPTIAASFSDGNDAGTGIKTVILTVNGTDVTRSAVISPTGLNFRPRNLPEGTQTVHLAVTDRAQNVAVADWQFTVGQAAPVVAITALTHDAQQPLRAGQMVKITARLAVTPARLEWYLDNRLISSAMPYDAATHAYTLAYRISAADPVGTAQVSLRCFTDAATSQTASAPQPLVIAAKPGIFAVAITDYTGPVKAGESFTILVTGTPGADQVTAHFANSQLNFLLAEREPGKYTQRVTVRPNTNIAGLPIFAAMRIGGEQLPEVRSEQTVTIDTTPPRITAVAPPANARLDGHTLQISAAFDDQESHIAAKQVRLLANGTDVTRFAAITPTGLTCLLQNLPAGPVALHLDVADNARNTAAADWQVTLAGDPTTPQPFTPPTHEPPPPAVKNVKFEITTPKDGKAPDSVTVAGTAQPGAQVHVTVTCHARVQGKAQANDLADQTVTATPDGAWTTPAIALPRPDNATLVFYTIEAEQLNAAGKAIKRDSVRLRAE